MSLETYGRYQLIKKLATGGMAQIYLARQVGPEGFEKTLVLKRILPHLAENEEFITMFLDEARIAARLNHPNVVQIFDLGAQDDSYFIAMEYIHGEDARRVWKQSERMERPIPQSLICRIIIESCAGLDYAHKKADASGRPLNIVHRDISPQNILVSYEGGVKVVDFGIAKAADQATVTRSGVLKGKYSYMSPEQAAGAPIDHRTDIFALGVVLWELLTGDRLFKRATDVATLNAVTECKLLPPSSVNPQIPKELDQLVMKALAKDRQVRFQEARHLGAALEEWMLKNQLPSSSAQLAEFMHGIYAERLKLEAEEGKLLVETIEASRNEELLESERKLLDRATPPSEPDPRRTKSLRANSPAASRSRPDLTSAERPDKSQSRAPKSNAQSVPSLPRARSSAAAAPRPEFRQTVELPNQGAGPSSSRLSPASAEPAPLAPRQTEPSFTGAQPEAASRTGLLLGVAAGALLLIGVLVALLLQNQKNAAAGAEVRLSSVPQGAVVRIDGEDTCTTPCKPVLAEGTHEVELTRDGFEVARRSLEVTGKGRIDPAPFVLVPKAQASPDGGAEAAASQVSLTIESQPAGARVLINEAESGTTPVTVRLPSDSMVSLRLELDGHVPQVDRFKAGAAPGRPYQLKALAPRDPHPVAHPPPQLREPEVKPIGNGTVRFVVKPWATVECPPYKFGDTPFPEQTMSAGDYRCRFKNDEGEKVKLVHVEAGKSQKVLVDFTQ